jgi:hypothetical protein
MKKLFFSLAAVICFAASASAQNEVPGAVNNNSNTSDENVNGVTKMDMQPGMKSVIQNQTPAGARAATPDDNTQIASPDANTGSEKTLMYNTDQNRRRNTTGEKMNNSATQPARANGNKR